MTWIHLLLWFELSTENAFSKQIQEGGQKQNMSRSVWAFRLAIKCCCKPLQIGRERFSHCKLRHKTLTEY